MGSAWRSRVRDGPPAWLPPSLTVLVVAACLVLGRTSPSIGFLVAAGLVAAAMLAPPLGLVALVAGNLVSQVTLVTGTRTELRFPVLAVLALAILWVAQPLWPRDLGVLRLPAVRAACALALVAAVAGAVGNLEGVGFGTTASLTAQVGGLSVFVYSAATLVLAADWLRDVRWLQRVTWVFLAVVAVEVAGLVTPELTEVRSWLVAPGTDGSVTRIWFAALATAQAGLNRTLHWRARLLLGLAVVGQFSFGLGAGREWAAGWLPPLIAVAAVGCLAAPRLGAALIGLGTLLAALNLPRLMGRVLVGDNQYSLDTRLEAWTIIVTKILPANPLLGLGPANYYHVTPQFPIRGYAVNFSAHSTYVDLLAQTGIIGLACFAWFVGAVAVVGWRLYRRAPDGFARAYAVGALGGLAGMLATGVIGDWLLPFVYNVTLTGLSASLFGWLFLGGLLALDRSTAPAAAAGAVSSAWHFWTTRRLLIAITAVAVLVRVVVAVVLGDAATAISGAADQSSYDALAQRVLAGHGFSFASQWYPFTQPDTPTAHWSYLYTLYLAAVYALVGHHPLAARLLQAIASGAGCWLIFVIGRRLFDERVGLAAAALTGVYAYFVFFNAALMTQTFFVLALLAALERALAIAARPTTAAWAALGVWLGVGVLLRQTLLLYVPLLLAWLAWTTRGRARLRDAALAGGLVALFIVPWTVRNYAAFGDFLLLNSNGGYFLYASNHPDQGTTYDPTRVPPVPEELRGLPEPAVDRGLFRAAAGFVAADPVRFLRLSWSRLGYYFWLLPSTASAPLANLARLCSFTLYLPFMLYGLVLSRHRWRPCMPLYLYLIADAAVHLGSWAAPRYRLPSDALLMVFAGLAVVDLAARLGRTERLSFARLSRVALAVLIGFLPAGAPAIGPAASSAQESSEQNGWSAPVEVFRGVERTTSPVLVTDSMGDAHLFFVTGEKKNETSTLMYARRSGESWTPAVAVVSMPDGQLAVPTVALDGQGWFHVAYQGGRRGLLKYQRVHLSRVTDPSAWSRELNMTDSPAFSSHIVAAPDGGLHFVYASRRFNIFYSQSDDGGRTWSEDVRVSAVGEGQAPNGPALTIDAHGWLHAVWTQFHLPSGWPPAGVHYSRSVDGGRSWSAPRQFAGEHYSEANVITRSPDEVHLAWNAVSGIGDRMHAWSGDGGETWTAPRRYTDRIRGGITGGPDMAVDSADTLHVITSVDGPQSIEQIFHLSWDGASWSAPALISAGTNATDSVEFAALAIGGGNHLHAAWEVDYRSIWATEMRTGAPASAPRPVPTMDTSLRAALADSSVPFRVLLAVLAFLAIEFLAESAWRRLAHPENHR